MRRNQTIEEQLSLAAPLMQFGISGRGERRTGGGLHSTKPEMFLASRRNLLFVFSGGKLQRTAPGDSGTAGHPIPSGAERTKASFWLGGCEYPALQRPLQGAARPAPPRRSAAPAWLRALGARPGAGRAASRSPHPRPPLPRRGPAPPTPAMSRGSRVALAVSALLSAAVVAAVHIQQRRELQRLRSGVVRDLERQSQKKENIRLLEEQIALTKQLMEERDKALMERRSQRS